MRIQFEDFSYFRVEANLGIMGALRRKYRYFVPGAQFSKPYKQKRWDGYKSLITQRNRLPLGALTEVLRLVKAQYPNEDISIPEEYIDLVEPFDFLLDIEVTSKGQRITPREDQWDAVEKCIRNNRCVCVAPTSFGKSLVIYLLCRYHITYGRKVLIVVPKKILVDQMIADFLDYGYEGDINGIYTGRERTSTDITVGTFQTMVKVPDLIDEFDCLIIDECHQAKSNSLVSIIEGASSIRYKYGLTGSLKEGSIEHLFASSYLGYPHYITDTNTLIKEQVVANLQVSIYRYVYPIHERGLGLDYQQEKEFFRNCEHRYKAILEEAGSLNKTGMIAVVEIEVAQKMYEMARGMYPDRNIYQIRGGVCECGGRHYNSFEEVKPLIEQETNALLIVGLKVFSTGVSVKNIHFGIMAVSTKSYTSVIQTIGRGLRVNKEKKDFLFIDWFDDITESSGWSYVYGHLLERIDIYKEQGWTINKKVVGEENQMLLKI